MANCVIKLYTIDDCEACKILRKNITDVMHNNYSLNIELIEEDATPNVKKILKSLQPYKLYDFPAFQFIKDGIVVLSDSGSRPITFLQRYIDLWFK